MRLEEMSAWMLPSKLEKALEPLFAFLAADRPFAEVSRLAVVSKTWRRVSINALKTAHQLNLSGFAESVRDEDVRLALVRVTSENLSVVNLSGCHNISPGGVEDILQYIAETCSRVKEVEVTACSNETVLRAVATRARVALPCPLALDLFALLRSLGEEGTRYSFSNLGSLLQDASPPHLVFDPALAPRKNALFQAAAHGTAPEVALLLSLSFAVGDQDESDEDDIRTYDVDEKDSEGNSPLLLACRSGNLEIAEILVCAGAGVSAANERGDTPLLAAVGAGELELAEMLVSKGANVEAVRMDGAGLLSLAIVSQQAELLNLALTCSPKRLQHQDVMSASELAAAFLDPARIEGWLRTGASPLGLAGQVIALVASCALESSTKNRLEDVRAFIFHNLDMLQDPSKWPVKHAVQQLASQEAGTVFGGKYADRDKAAGESRFITLINKREKHLCRSIHRAQSEVTAVCYSPDGSKLARAEGSEVVVCDACTGFVQKTLSGHSGSVWSVCFTPDGKHVASGSGDKTVKIWETSTGTCRSTLSGHKDSVLSVCFSPCGTKILSGGGWPKDRNGNGDFSLRIWDAETGTQIGSPLSGHSSNVSSVSFSPDGKQVASGSWDKTVKLWETSTGTCDSTLSGHSRGVWSVAWSSDGTKIASGSSDKTLKIWNAKTGNCDSTLSGHSDLVRAVSWSPTGTMLASGSDDKTIKLWDAQSAKVISTLSGHSSYVLSVSFSPDDKQVVSGSYDNSVKIWQTSTGTCVSTLSGHSGSIRSVCFSPNGKHVASGSADNTVKIWETSTGTCQSTLNGHSCPVTSVAWNNDGSKLATGSYDNTVKIWSVGSAGTFECQSTLNVDSPVWSVAFSPDGSKIAAAHGNKIQIFDAQTQAKLGSLLNRNTSSVTKLEYVDAKTLVSSSEDGTMRVWSVDTGAPKGELDRGSFAFSKDSCSEQKVDKYSIAFNKNLLLISEDQSVVAFFRAPHVISAIGRDGERIGVGCNNGEVLQLRAHWLV